MTNIATLKNLHLYTDKKDSVTFYAQKKDPFESILKRKFQFKISSV